MAVTWSRLHEVLGIEPRALTYADIVRAADQQVREDSFLDWKAERRTDEHAKEELAKDVAAMANSGGGVLVFGVAEVGQEKYPEIRDIELAEQGEQQIRSIVWERVRPLVSGIEVVPLENPDATGRGVLAVVVPASTEAPHFYEKSGQPPVAPWRNGLITANLRERDLERAYRDRFARQDDARTALATLAGDTSDRLLFESGNGSGLSRWCVVAAHPFGAVPLAMSSPTAGDARAAAEAAVSDESTLVRSAPNRQFGSLLRQVSDSPRRGLRRWILRHPWSRTEDDGRAVHEYAELHQDGSVVFAVPAGDYRTPGTGDGREILMADVVERSIVAALALTRAWQRARSVAGPYAVRVEIVADPSANGPTWIFGRQPYGAWQEAIPVNTAPVRTLKPVDAVLDARATVANNRETAIELAEGILHQFEYGLINAIIGEDDVRVGGESETR